MVADNVDLFVVDWRTFHFTQVERRSLFIVISLTYPVSCQWLQSTATGNATQRFARIIFTMQWHTHNPAV
jgi:hypothetical protein